VIKEWKQDIPGVLIVPGKVINPLQEINFYGLDCNSSLLIRFLRALW